MTAGGTLCILGTQSVAETVCAAYRSQAGARYPQGSHASLPSSGTESCGPTTPADWYGSSIVTRNATTCARCSRSTLRCCHGWALRVMLPLARGDGPFLYKAGFWHTQSNVLEQPPFCFLAQYAHGPGDAVKRRANWAWPAAALSVQ